LTKKKNKSKSKWILISIAIVIVVLLFAFIFLGQVKNIEVLNTEQNQQTLNEKDACRKNSECFLVNCKSTPNIVECVNATHEELYYKQCNGWNDVNPAQNFERCSCVQNICVMIS